MRLRIGGVELRGRKLAAALALAVALAALALLYRDIDIGALHRRAERLDGVAVFIAITILPMLGLPVSVFHAVAGVRFGFPGALGVVALSLLFQLLGSYALVRAAPQFFARRLQPLRERLPRAAHRPLTQFTMLLPGAPFFAQNYVLPLVGVPLSTYLLWAFPLHLSRSVVGILFGEMSDELTAGRAVGFLVYFAVLLLACTWAFRRLRARLQDRSPVASGQTRPA